MSVFPSFLLFLLRQRSFIGGTFGFEGLSGKFVVNKIVQGEFPPPSPPVIQYNVFQIDFEFTTDDDEFDFGPYPNPFE